MALDGVITKVERTENGVRITLSPRKGQDYIDHNGDLAKGYDSCPGQSSLLIVGATFEPVLGDQIWGGSGFAILISGDIEFPYKRQGYTELIEDWDTKSSIEEAHKVSATPEVAREYLESQGVDVDAFVQNGLAKIKTLQERIAQEKAEGFRFPHPPLETSSPRRG